MPGFYLAALALKAIFTMRYLYNVVVLDNRGNAVKAACSGSTPC